MSESATAATWTEPAEAAAPAAAMSGMTQLVVVTLIIGGLLLLALEAWGYYCRSEAAAQARPAAAGGSSAPEPPLPTSDPRTASSVTQSSLANAQAGVDAQPEMATHMKQSMTGSSMATSRAGARTMMDASYVNVPSADVDADFEFVGRS